MLSYKELDFDDNMAIEAVPARGNKTYDLSFVDNVDRFQMHALNPTLNSKVF